MFIGQLQLRPSDVAVNPELEPSSVSWIVSGVNTEAKIILLHLAPDMQSHKYLNRFDLRDSLQELGVDVSARRGMPVGHVGLVLRRLAAKGFLDGDHEEGWARTHLGDRALGVGGGLIDIGHRNEIPVKTIAGESTHHSIPSELYKPEFIGTRTDQSERKRLAMSNNADGVLSRMMLWAVFTSRGEETWVDDKEVYAYFQERSFPRSRVHEALRTFGEAGVLVSEKIPSDHRSYRRRFNTELGAFYTIGNEYLALIGKLAVGDVDLTETGSKKVELAIDAMAATKHGVNELFRRTAITTPHLATRGVAVKFR